MNKNTGFTLLELMITIAIMGIVVSIALPAYYSYAARSRRVEARQVLQTIAQQIDQNYRVTRNYKQLADKREISDATLALWGLDKGPPAGHEHYKISFVNNSINESGYVLQAQAVGVQAGDKDCLYFFYDQSGVKMASTTATVPNGSRDQVSQACWAK